MKIILVSLNGFINKRDITYIAHTESATYKFDLEAIKKFSLHSSIVFEPYHMRKSK